MRIFLIKIIQVTLLVFSFTAILDFGVTRGLQSSKSNKHYKLNMIYNGEINADWIINGSSKALFQVSTKIIDSILGVNSFNLGMDGTPFLPQYVQFEQYLKYNKKPDAVIQVVSNQFLIKLDELYEYMKFAPYLYDENIADLTRLYEGFDTTDYYLPMMRYSGSSEMIVNGLLNNFNIDLNEAEHYKGSVLRDWPWDNSFNDFVKQFPDGIHVKINDYCLERFENYIQYCKRNEIDLYLVYPPTYIESQPYIQNRNEIISLFHNLASKHQIPFLDYSQIAVSNHKENFYNSQHLNKVGAEKFSTLLAEEIQKIKDQ